MPWYKIYMLSLMYMTLVSSCTCDLYLCSHSLCYMCCLMLYNIVTVTYRVAAKSMITNGLNPM